MKRLLLVDGSSYLYRAFHAMPDLRNQAGEPTGAIYGMLNMLRRLAADYNYPFLDDTASTDGQLCAAVVFDAPGGSFRETLYPDYKAQRKAMPDDLVKQIEPIHEAVRALGWPLLHIGGIEADDVIGTLCVMAVQQGFDEVIVSTGDKDLAQLVNAQVRLVNTMTGEVLDEAGVWQKFAVRPDQIVDFLTLMGDKVDNVPGVEKVGEKTAAKWLAEYGTLDAVVAAADQIKGVVGGNLRAALGWLPTGKQLVTIKTDCDLGEVLAAVDDLQRQPLQVARLMALFTRYELNAWRKQLLQHFPVLSSWKAEQKPLSISPRPGNDVTDSAVPSSASHQHSTSAIECMTVNTEALFERMMAEISRGDLVAFDTETNSLNAMDASLVGLAFAVRPGQGFYLPLAHSSADGHAPPQLTWDQVRDPLTAWFTNARIPKVAQHAKYDLHVLANVGISVAGLSDDTLLMSYVLHSHLPHNMDALAQRLLGYTTLTYEQVVGKGSKAIPFAQVPIDTATRYAAEDAEVTLRLQQVMAVSLQAPGAERLMALYREIERPLLWVLLRMERHGVLIDSEHLQRQSEQLAKRLQGIEQEAFALAGGQFNLSSPKQVAEILFEKMGIPVVKKTPTGAPSTDETVLSELAHHYPLPAKLLEHRTLSKLKTTYTDKLPKMVNARTGRIHTHYAQAVAVTGRLSSNEPNLQNIPIRTEEGRQVRAAFLPAEGHRMVSADYSQIELRIMAHLSGDEALCRAFASGEDVHRLTAAEIFGMAPEAVQAEHRRVAKVINFGLIYGMSPFGLAANLGITRDAARLYMDRYFARYPGVAAYMERTRLQAKQQGYVETVFGRRLWLPEINSPNGPRRAVAERAAINAPMQGTAADLIKKAMIAIDAWLQAEQLSSRMIMQVHDEVVLEVPQAEVGLVMARLPGLMTGVAQLAVPLEVSVASGLNWEQAHA